MDFFAHQQAARKRTSLLLSYYAMAVLLLVFATYVAAMLVFHWKGSAFAPGRLDWWHPRIFLGSMAGTLGVIATGTLFRLIQLRQGGSAVAQMLGGTLVAPGTTDVHEQRLRNVIEEMAIASGVPVPEVYLLPDEPRINAFAAGHSTNDAAIGVTQGCVRRLNRDELQGVIAHEFSHILNGDMRLNIRLMGLLHGILCIYLVGRTLLRVRSRSSRSKKGGNPLPLFGLLLIIIGGLGVFFGRLIQAAVSRQREFLADAAAVQFTRNSQGIAGALKRIGGSTLGSSLEASQASAASHLFFSNGLREAWFSSMATHPPLRERIARIDPGFDGTFPDHESVDWEGTVGGLKAPIPFHGAAPFNRSSVAPSVPVSRIVRRVGETASVEYAANLIQSIPSSLRAAANNSWNAAGVIFALVLSADAQVRAQQLAHLATLDTNLAPQVVRYASGVAAQDSRTRLLLLNLALPALRMLSREQWTRMRQVLDQLVGSDAQIDLFEFVLRRIIERNIDAHFEPRKAAVTQFYSFAALSQDCEVLLSALVHVGAADAARSRETFEQGAATLPFATLHFLPPARCGVQAIDSALSRIGQAVPHIKKTVLEACARAVAADGFVAAQEAELLRAIAESFECPMPPFVAGL
jgi:Zn-dependent protease with chaperone function